MELPFGGIETRNSTATEFWNNWRVARLNRRLAKPLAEYGGSDAYFLWALGRTWTDYSGQGFADLRRAFAQKATRAGGLTWVAVGLLRYFYARHRWQRFCQRHKVH